MSSPASTHFRLTQTELHASALRAQVLERCRRTLNHDMNNAVQSIHSGLELLSKCINTPGIARVSPQECIALLQQQFTSLQQTLNKLIDEIAEAPGATESFDLSALVHEALQMLRHERAIYKAQLRIDPAVHALARKVNVRTFVLALLLDAVDHLPAQAALAVTVTSQNDQVSLEIRGSLASSPEAPSERTMTIMQLVKHLVSAEEGELRVEQIAQERVLTLQLPASAEQPVGEPTQTAAGSNVLRVLIVDRNRDAADSLAMIVQLEGYESHAIYAATQLADTLKGFAPDVVLLDSDLPGCDLNEVPTIARQLPSPPMLIQVSSSSGTAHAGFDARVVRPVEWPQLQRLLSARKA
jgi:CheY-like chemotaxis protein